MKLKNLGSATTEELNEEVEVVSSDRFSLTYEDGEYSVEVDSHGLTGIKEIILGVDSGEVVITSMVVAGANIEDLSRVYSILEDINNELREVSEAKLVSHTDTFTRDGHTYGIVKDEVNNTYKIGILDKGDELISYFTYNKESAKSELESIMDGLDNDRLTYEDIIDEYDMN